MASKKLEDNKKLLSLLKFSKNQPASILGAIRQIQEETINELQGYFDDRVEEAKMAGELGMFKDLLA